MPPKLHAAFIISTHPESHQQRRKEILCKYPQVAQLFGLEYKTKYIVMALVMAQLCLAYYSQYFGWFGWFLSLYFVGATLSHSTYTAIHEITHNLAFNNKITSKLFAIFTNLPLGIPMAMGFEKYHFIHHRFLGDTKKDVDIPLEKEARFFISKKGKLLWLLLQPLTYGIRPFFKYPQRITAWELFNITVQIAFNCALVFFFGWNMLLFLLLCALLAMSVHPTAAHAIAEHYVVSSQQETYSYYGPLNYLLFNVGHHVEHHDFPAIPWSRIHQLKKIAPEYYEKLYIHHSWVGLMIRFVFSKDINLM